MELYNGDCLEVMKSIPDDSVDMVLTDLPYGTTRNAWDSIIPFEPLWAQLKRVTKRGGAIALHADMPFAAKLVCSNLPWYRYELIWEKPMGSDFLNANRKPLKNHESIQIFSECQTKTYNPQFTFGSPYVRTRTSKSLNYGECGSVCTTISEGGATSQNGVAFCHRPGKDSPHAKARGAGSVAYPHLHKSGRDRAGLLHGQRLHGCGLHP